jgi:SnoaL-like domain
VDRRALQAWVELYERAWRSPGTELLAELFANDAEYRTSPFADPKRGLAAIGELWDAEREGPDESFTFSSEILAVDGDLGVVQTEVFYERTHRGFRNLWLVRLAADGRCTSFEEWFWEAPS